MKTIPIAFLVYFACSTFLSEQGQAAPLFLELGLSSEYFHYEEQNIEGLRLNREEGQLNGGFVSFGYQPTLGTEWLLTHQRVYGEVEYRGQTQSGASLNTQTKEKFDLFSIRFKRCLGNVYGISGFNWYVSTALNYRNWERKIQPSSGALGLNENYTWNEFDLSIEADFKVSEKGMMTTRIGSVLGFNEKIDVDLTAIGAGKPSFNLGEVKAQHFSLGYKYAPQEGYEVSLLASYEYWHFDRSRTHIVNAGPRSIKLTEPESDMQRAGVHVQLRSFF